MIINNYIHLTGYEEVMEKINESFFKDMLLTICRC